MLERRDAPTTVVETEPNNLLFFPNDVPIATGDVFTTASNDWLTVQGAIDSTTDRDYFRITLPTASGVFLNINSRDIGLSTTLNTVVDVYDSNGTTLLGNNDEGYDFDTFVAPTSGVAQASTPDAALYLDLGPGTYLVRVTSALSQSFGPYQLRMLADTQYSATVPTFNSRLSAPVSLYLDFDGHTATDSWGTYTATPYNLAGSPTVVSPGERLAIRNNWRIVAEDHSLFNVNVTTTEPASFADGVAYRVVISADSGAIVGQSASARGTAISGSFAGAGVNTGFVFQGGFGDYLGGVSGKMVATALEMGNEASFEFGIALGLKHFGGVNTQPAGIMQSPDTGLNRSTWSSGFTHSGEPPVVMQDDVAVITSATNGISYSPDDHGDTIATATIMTGNSISGLLNSTTDRDFIGFNAPQGNAIINISRDGYAGNADLELRVYSPFGVLLATVAPTNSFDAGVTVYVPTLATYYAEIRGSSGAAGTYRMEVGHAPVNGPAQVLSTTVNVGAVQRSNVKELGLVFSRPMFFPSGVAAAFAVTNAMGAIPIDIDLSGTTPSQTVATIRFPNGAGGFGSVPDGVYQLMIFSAYCLDDTGQPLDGDNNGVAGGNFAFGFHRLFGDHDGDRAVATNDFIQFRLAFGGNNPIFDFDGDGYVSANDFNQFRLRFGATV